VSLASNPGALSLLGSIATVSAAATVNATSAWIDVRNVEGEIVVASNIGIITGTNTPTIEDATDGAGAGGATFTALKGGAFTVVTTSNDPLFETRVLDAKATRGWIRYVGTIATGPSLIGVAIYGRNKTV
jgi:hypothetical protein